MPEILVLYYTSSGSLGRMAQLIARGIDGVPGISSRIRTVPKVSALTEKTEPTVPVSGTPYVTNSDIQECSGLAIGSPTRFGNMAAPMKYFIDSLAGEWMRGSLIGKPAAVFTSAGSLHGGHETTLVSMMLPLLHHGMIIVGIPYSVTELSKTQSGGTPYGASHHAGENNELPITPDEKEICIALGKRLAETSIKVNSHQN